MQQQLVTRSEWKYNMLYIITWYSLSTMLSIYNKTIMAKDHLNLPLFMSATHAGIHTLITRILIDKHQLEQYSLRDYMTKIVPCGMAAALEICCGNASLVLITLSFYTMIKSSTPVWVLAFSFVFGFEKLKLNLIGIISVIVFGVCLTIDGEPDFDLQGCVLVLFAAIASGLRWNMTQYMMRTTKKTGPMDTMYRTSPVMFVTMLLLSLYIEQPFYVYTSFKQGVVSLCIMSIGGILAFVMTLAELYLIKGTSTVTLSVAGISKEIVVIGLSVLIYGDVLTLKTYMGLFISILGIIGYNYYKYSQIMMEKNK